MKQGRKVGFYTLGCKLNFAETSTIGRQLIAEGYEKVDFEEHADVYVINTCSVTENADKDCKRIVRSALKKNPEALIAIIGCYAQLKPEEISKIEGVDLVLGAREKFRLHHYIEDLNKENSTAIHSCEVEEANFFVSSYALGDRTRAFLKVQDGCDYPCTYCTIPLARGASRSDELENVIAKAREIAEKGAREIVLTGVNIGDYGKGEFGNKKHEHTFIELVQELDQVDEIYRFRISSIEPNLLKNETIDFVAQSNKFVPHFHIPLQSGSNKTLARMKRRYRKELYEERVSRIKETMPDACIGVDVIVGFPGETEEDFQETYKFLNELPVSYFHVFSYSERANTEAAEMEGVVPKQERSRRSKMLRILSAKKKEAFYLSQLGKTKVALLEAENKDGFMHGFTENYVKIKLPYQEALVNQLIEVELLGMDDKGLVEVKELASIAKA